MAAITALPESERKVQTRKTQRRRFVMRPPRWNLIALISRGKINAGDDPAKIDPPPLVTNETIDIYAFTNAA